MKEKVFRCHCGASYTLRHSLLRHQAQYKDCHCREGEQGSNKGTEATHPHSRPVWGRPKKSQRTEEEEDGDEQEEGATVRERGDGGEEKGKGAERVKRRPLEERGGGGQRAAGGAGGLRRIRRAGAGEAGELEMSSDGAQHTVVYVQTLGGDSEARTTQSSGPVLLASEVPLLQGAGHEQEMVEVVMSEGGEQCIVVHGQQMAGGLVILQGGVCSVAQTVEIESG